jgi:hypothetical protein
MVTTPPSDYPWEDLPEWEARFNRSTENFLDSMHSYDTYGLGLKGKVVERLRRLADPPDRFPEDSVQAAAQLEAALNHFPMVQFRLTNNMTLIKLAVGQVGGALGQYFLRSTLDRIRRSQPGLLDASKQDAQAVSDTAKTVLDLATVAFDAATAVVPFRIAFLRRFLETTDPPPSIPGIDDETLRKIAAEAAANEVLLAAGEVALDHLRLEWARHVPIATIFASLASYALDVNKEVKNLKDNRVLWMQLLDAPYQPNVGDQARRGAQRIQKDDEKIDRLFESLNETVQRLMELIRAL